MLIIIFDIYCLINTDETRNFIKTTLDKIAKHEVELHGGCVACHVIFSLKEEQGSSEQDAADLLSEILTGDSKLNSEFIEAVEQIHMHERNLASVFATKDGNSKTSNLELYFQNILNKLASNLNFTKHKIIF